MWFFFVLLSVSGWAVLNVLDSVLVHGYEKKPMALMWSQSLISLPLLLLVPLFFDVGSSWIPVLLAFGMLGYGADLWFFRSLESVDVSVINIAWATLSIFLSFVGFYFFDESWSFLQTAGALLVIGGVAFFSVYHQHIRFSHTFGLLGILACAYLPYYVVKKVALDAGESALPVFFWMLLGRESLSFGLPWFFPDARRRAVAAMRGHRSFTLINIVVIAAFFLAELAGTWAYATGPLSLVVIVNNVQPFLVMGLAWFCVRIAPSRAPKELLTRQSVRIKTVSFLIVFAGLALLAGSK